jgi:hypothetical protein
MLLTPKNGLIVLRRRKRLAPKPPHYEEFE